MILCLFNYESCSHDFVKVIPTKTATPTRMRIQRTLVIFQEFIYIKILKTTILCL